MKPTFTNRKNFHYQIILILCLLLASAISGFSRERADLSRNAYLRSDVTSLSYLDRYKEGIRTLYSFDKIAAVYRATEERDNTTPTVFAQALPADTTLNGQCYSELFSYCSGAEIEIEIEAETGYQNYKWFKDGVEIAGVTGSVYTITSPGSYYFTAEDPETCEARLCCPYLVTQEQDFDFAVVETDAGCAAGTTGSITITPTTGNINDFMYSLDGAPFQASNVFAGLAGGAYTVTVKNGAGCLVEKSVTIDQPDGIVATAETECVGDLTTAAIVVSGGVAPYTYSLNGGTFGGDSLFVGLPQGQHEVLVKDANGCTYKVRIDAFCDCTPEIFEYCPGEAIEILAEALTGQGNYQWYKDGEAITGATDSVYTITAVGTYHYTAGGGDNCEGELCCPIIVREKDAPAVSLTDGELSCDVTSLQLNTGADPANTFSWSGPNGFTGNTPAVTVTEPGTYIVTVTGLNGCTTLDTAVVRQDSQLPTVTVTGGELTCDVPTLELVATGSAGVSYSWSGPGGVTSSTDKITATVAGNYIVTVTSANGCIASDTATVTDNKTLPTVTVTGGELTCDVPTLELVATGSAGVSYSWSGPGGVTSSTDTLTATVAGDYIVTVTSANGCIASDTAKVTENKVLPTVTTQGGELNCDEPTLKLVASGSAGVSYSWSGPGGVTASTDTLTATVAGDYIVTVTSANGCIASDTATVTENKVLPTVTVTGGELTCDVPTLELVATGSAGVSYSWSGPGGATSAINKITATVAGDYIVTVTSANGCVASDTAKVTENKVLPTVTVTGGELTCDVPTLKLVASASAGVSYRWRGPGGVTATTDTLTVTETGQYIVTVTSANGCVASDTATVTRVESPTLVASVSCVDNNGKVVLVASGGKAPYTYSRDGVTFQAEAEFSGLPNGNYIFTVKDANGCIFTVTAAVKCEIICVPQIYSFCENEAIEITIEAEEGLTNYQWYKNGEVIAGATGWIYTATEPGRYYYTAGTGDMCDGIMCCPIEIIRFPGFVATALAGSLDCTNGPVVPVTVSVSGGTAPFTYSSDGVTYSANPVFQVGPGTHKFYVKDANGCINETNSVVVPDIKKPDTPLVTVDETTLCGNAKATLTAACAAGEVVQWNNNMVGTTIQVGVGTYWAVCINECGASPASGSVTIIKKQEPTPPMITTDKNFVCGNELAVLSAICTVGDVIEWSDGQYGNSINVGPGVYSARCKNECGISKDSGKITITGGKVPGTPDVGTDKAMVCGDEKATLVAHCEVGSFAVWNNGMIGSPIQVGEGIYTAICRSDCGDSGDSRHITINKGLVPAPPTLSATKVLVCGDEKTSITATCEVGATIHWDNNMTGKTIYVGAGIYRAVCKNTCGTSSESIPVIIGKDKDPAAPSVATDKTTVCGEETATLTALCESGIITWNNGRVGSPIQVGTGTYTANCTNDCGVSVASTPITITSGGVPNKPVVTAEKTTVCGDELVKLTAYCASGTISWIGVNGFNNSVYVGTGIYAAKCTNSCGTSVASDPVVINPGTTPEKPIITTNTIGVCGNELATLSAVCPTGGEPVWSTGVTASSIQVGIGLYTARCVSACGPSVISDRISIEPGGRPARPTITTNKPSVCGEDKAMLTGTCPGGGVLTWSNGMTGSPILVGTGTYFATCVNECGASQASASITITTGQLPGKPVISTNTPMVCGDDKATLSAICPSGGAVTWSNGMTGAQILVNAGMYYATCVSDCGVSAKSETIVIVTGTAPAKPSVSTDKTALCEGEVATLTGSCISGTLVWNNGLTGTSIQVRPGTYTATCTNNCGTSTASNSITINHGPVPTQPSIHTNKLSVCGVEKATLTGSCPTGGILTWNNGMTGSPILVGAGTYTATCVSTCGTSAVSAPIVIGTGVAPAAPSVTASKTLLCGVETATLTATCTTGTVLWGDGSAVNPRSVGAGTYTAVCVSDCGASVASVPIVITTQPAPNAPSVSTNKTSVCGAEKATLTGSCPTGGTLTWNNGMTGSPILVGAGTYTATCVSTCGTSAVSAPIVIGTGVAPAAPSITASKTLLCGTETATLTATCTTGTVLWGDGSAVNPRSVGAGTYTAVCVSDCGASVASVPVVITTQPAPNAPSVSTNKTSVCGAEKATLSGSCPTGGILTWNNGMTSSPILVGAGTYTATCVSTCGTSAVSAPIVIGGGDLPAVPSVMANTTSVCGTDKATIAAVCATGTVVWNNGLTGSPIQVGAGTYTATCRTDCGNSPASAPVVITQGQKPAAPTVSTNMTTVCDNEKATLTAVCTTGTVLWSDGNTANPRTAGAGTYTAICVNACGGSDNSNTIVINRGPVPAKPSVQTNRTTVCGIEKAALSGACPSGGTLTWNNGMTGSPILVGVGTYTATCVNACGASEASAPIVIGDGSKPAAPMVTTSKSVLCGSETATLTASGCAGGVIHWSNGGTGLTKVVTAGTYTATCVTICGTSDKSAPITINQESAPANFTISTSTATVCGTEKATLTATGCEGGTVTWSTGATGASIQVGGGSYSATCKTTCGGTVSAGPIVITQENTPARPSVTTNKTTVCGDEKATLTATGCAGTLAWYKPGSGGATPIGNGTTVQVGAGTYTVTCTTTCATSPASDPVTIGTSDKPAAPWLSADKTNVCEGDKATITATGCAGTLTWSNSATGTSIQVGAGTYTATCTTACGTSVSSLPVIIGTSVKPAAPSVTANRTTVCEGEKATLTATGCAGTISWSNGATGTSIQVGAGTYTATCTAGCGTSDASATVVIGTSPAPAAPSVTANKATVCENEKATLTATGCAGGTITWSTGQTVGVIQVGAGSYTATCTTACGTSVASVPVVIGTSDKPAAPAVSADKAAVCEGEKATLTATGCAGTITWSTGQTVSVIQVGAGTYTATCTTSCGTSNASVAITIGTSDKPAAPTVASNKATVCEGEKATLTATGCAGTVTWSNGSNGVSIQVGAGTYTATCTTSCGTSNASAAVTIGTSDKPAAPAVASNKATVCEGEKATLTATGCTGTVNWSGGQTGTSIQVGAGTYTATCTSSCGTSDASVAVTIGTSDKPAPPALVADKATVCESEVATLTANGCAGTVTWSNGTSGVSIQVGAGTYTATCTTGCGTSEVSAPVTIGTSEKPAKPMITASGTSVCGEEKVTLTASGCAGTVNWSNGATGTSILVGAGTYTATCTTGCGTSDPTAVSISEGGSPEPPVVTADKGSLCGSEKATLTATGCVGGVIHWSTDETGFQIEVGAGVYTATCVDACGNESIACIAVEIDTNSNAPDSPIIWQNTDGVCGNELATLVANGCTGGTIIWSNGSEGYSIEVSAGRYTAICKNECGESAASAEVTILAKGGTLTVSSDKAAYCAGEQVTLTATGCDNGTVRWSNGATGTTLTLVATADMTMTAVCSAGGASGACDFAVGDVAFEYVAPQNPNGMNTRFVLTDNSYQILQVKPTPAFENVQEGSYKVISVVYIGELSGLAAGANYSDLDKGDCYSDEETEISVCDAETSDCEAVGTVQVHVKSTQECGGGNNGGSEVCETAPTVISSVGSATCVGTSVTLTALNCNAQVVWNTGATGASIHFVPTATGSYSFSAKCVSLVAGCESELSQEVTVNVVEALPKPMAIETLNNICPLAYVDLRNAILGEPTTGGTFEFRYGNTTDARLVTSAQVTTGVYYLFERNTAGCYSEPTAVTVTISDDCENPVYPTAVDVAVTKTGDKETAEVGEQVTYTVTVTNVGESGASDIVVTDRIPVGLDVAQVGDHAFIEDGEVKITLDTLAPGASATVTYTATVTAPGRIANLAELSGIAQSDTNNTNDSSVWVINPVAPSDSLIGLAKAVGTIAERADMGTQVYEVPFIFTITNMGLSDLDHVRLTDTLSTTFGNTEMIESVHLEADSGLTVNPNYTGSGDETDLLIADQSTIAAGATLNVRMKVFVNMSKSNSVAFANSATVYAGTVNEISDRSTDGVNADPDNDGDPTNNSTPTEFTIGDGTPTYGIGAALAVIDSAFVNVGTGYEVTYLVQIRNYGADTVSGVFLTDSLAHTFPEGTRFTVTAAPAVISSGSSLLVNDAFDGKTDFRILLPDGEATLAPGQTDSVTFKVTVVFGDYTGPYSTNVIAFAEDNGAALTDISNAGLMIEKHLSTPTEFNVPGDDDPSSLVEIPEGFSPNGDGINDNWIINVKGDAKIEKLIIVNRYGATLYEEDGETVSTLGWDGKANKGLIPGAGTVPTGTYFYKLKLVGQEKYIINYITVEK